MGTQFVARALGATFLAALLLTVRGDATPLSPFLSTAISTVSIASEVTSPAPELRPITFTASATDGTAPYQFAWFVFDGTTWTAVRNWSTDATFQWVPSARGSFRIGVWARSAGSAAAAAEAVASVPYEIVVAPHVAAVAISSDLTAPQAPGATITWSATATGGAAPYQYKWLVQRGAEWTVARDWSPDPTFMWTPVLNGMYNVGIWARSAGAAFDRAEATAAVPFAISGPPIQVSSLTVSSNISSPQLTGKTIHWTASASGGRAPYEFTWFWRSPVTGVWIRATAEWIADATFDWTPTEPGYYEIGVWARSAGSTYAIAEAVAGAPFVIEPRYVGSVVAAPGETIDDVVVDSVGLTTVLSRCAACGNGSHNLSWYTGDGTLRNRINVIQPVNRVAAAAGLTYLGLQPSAPGAPIFRVNGNSLVPVALQSPFPDPVTYGWQTNATGSYNGTDLYYVQSSATSQASAIVRRQSNGQTTTLAVLPSPYIDGRITVSLEGVYFQRGDTIYLRRAGDGAIVSVYAPAANAPAFAGAPIDGQDGFLYPVQRSGSSALLGRLPADGSANPEVLGDTLGSAVRRIPGDVFWLDATTKPLQELKLVQRLPPAALPASATGAVSLLSAGEQVYAVTPDAIVRLTTQSLREVALGANRAAPQPAGTSVTFSASASAEFGGAEFTWWILDADGGAQLARDWSTNPDFSLALPARASVRIGVWARTVGHTGGAEATAALTYSIGIAPPTDVAISSDFPSGQSTGTAVTFTASATGGVGPLQYKWFAFTGGTWVVIRDWGSGNTATWAPTLPGAWRVGVWVCSAGAATDVPQVAASIPFATSQGHSWVTLAPDDSSPQAPGTPIAWTASTTLGAGAQFKWFVFDGTAWTLARDWSVDGTFAWTPDSPNDSYKVGVWVRRATAAADAPEGVASVPFPIREP